uniref:Helicase ATP-binding domain-containing protein n=1 Tax=Parascaris equorum TaxID=6256 RepID=A0A914RME5_PAREQ
MDEFSFPFPPYDIQVSLMHEIRKCIEGGKVGIFESPTGTERAQLEKQLRDAEEIGNVYPLTFKANCFNYDELIIDGTYIDEEDDWVAAYKKKFEARRQANGELPLSNENDGDDDPDKVGFSDQRGLYLGAGREVSFLECKGEKKDRTRKDLILYWMQFDNELTSQSNEEEPSCTKIFYASRTHSQLQQFASEILKTRFRARIVTVGSRQALCVNDVVRSLKHSHLINEKCDELRQKKNANKRQKADQNHKSLSFITFEMRCVQMERRSFSELKVSNRVPQCSCPYWRADPIEDLTDQILSLKLPTVSKVVQSGKALFACPYFASRNSLAMCQVVLLPYQ